MKNLLNKFEKERIKLLYESKGMLLFEENIFGTIAKKALSWIGKNEDDIAKLFKTSEITLAKSIDDIIVSAAKLKNVTQLDDIQKKLMHFFNPSGKAENIPKAQQQMKTFLNGYAKSKGKLNWGEIRNEVEGKVESSTSSNFFKDVLKGRTLDWSTFTDPNRLKGIDWNRIQYADNIDDYNKVIAHAIKTGDYHFISVGGFERFGISNFREAFQKRISKINSVDPSKGIWSVTFK